MSYNVGAPIMVGDWEVLRGTASLGDVATWPGVVTGGFYGKLWSQAVALAKNALPAGFVGHSLGAAYARELSKRFGGEYVGYGRPGWGRSDKGDVANLGDPFTLFLRGHHVLAFGHSLASYA